VQGFADSGAALRWLDALARDPTARCTTAWSLAQVLEHAAQSIEFSLDGYPQPKPAWFQASAGALAFALFSRRGRMHHSTVEPIPGAPALASHDVAGSAARARDALLRFEAQPPRRALAPHFAYGPLSHGQYRRAHLMHLAEHARDVVSG